MSQQTVVLDGPARERAAISRVIRESAITIGFEAVGITGIEPSEHATFYRNWLAAGRHGSMSYLSREDAVRARVDARTAWPGVRSAVVVALHYASSEAPDIASNDDDATAATATSAGIIARYARGRDYHKVMKRRLLTLLSRVETELGRALPLARTYVDTGPVFERDIARRAGLGWFGRNTMLIHPRRGSYFFLGTLLLDIELDYDAPFEADHCGTCRNCVAACPTGALLGRDESGAPVMDATRCISYLTIENRGEIPRALRPLMTNRVFGCDICNEACPWNGPKFVTLTRENDFAPRNPNEAPRGVEQPTSHMVPHPGTRSPSLIALMSMDDAAWESFSRGSAIRRAGRAGFLRNVAVALGNARSAEAVPVLTAALSDVEPLIRGHAAWALGEVGVASAEGALVARRALETDSAVRGELDAAIDRLATSARP